MLEANIHINKRKYGWNLQLPTKAMPHAGL
jgi:hypothetical protein